MMTNSEIARKITQKGIPEGMTLGQAFTRAIELEAGYQLSEGVSLARPPEIMQVQEIEEVDEIGAMQRRLRYVVCWGCGGKGHLQRDCPHRTADMQDDGFDDSNAYAGKSEQVIRIIQPITVTTRDNIYKHMATQRTRANLYKAGYRRTKAALQEQQKINAAMTTTLAAQNPTVTTQTVTTSPRVVQPKTVKTQVTQNPTTTTQVVQIPTIPGSPGTGNVTTQQGQVRYIRVPPGTTRTAYNLRSTPLNNVTAVTTPATATTAVAPVTVGRGGGSPQVVQVKQEPVPPGNIATPKASSTVIKRGKGRGQKTSTISVVEAMPEEDEYFVEVGEEDLEGSDSDPTDLYEILAEINGPEEEIEEGLEPEIKPPIRLNKGYNPEIYLPKPKHRGRDLFVNMVTVGSAIGATIPTTFGQTKCNVLIDTGAMKSCMSQAYYQQLMLPATRSIHSFSIKSANGTNLCPIGFTECEFKIGTKEYKNDFIVCKNLVWPCILGTDFLRKHGIWTGWSPAGKFQLISQQKFLVESLEVLMKGPMIHNRQGINIPGRNLAVVSVLLDTKALQENQVYEVKPNLLLTNEHPNLVVLPMLHVVQREKHDSIPMALINLNEDEKIFLKKGEILGCLEPSPIEVTEIVREECNKVGEIDEKEDESIPLEKKFITSPAEVNTHRKMQLQDAEVTEEYREKFRLLCQEFEDVFSKDSTDIGKTPLITMDIDTGDSPPVCQRPYNLPLKHREWVQKELETLERAGMIVRSISPWASPIVVVPKKTEPGEPPKKEVMRRL